MLPEQMAGPPAALPLLMWHHCDGLGTSAPLLLLPLLLRIRCGGPGTLVHGAGTTALQTRGTAALPAWRLMAPLSWQSLRTSPVQEAIDVSFSCLLSKCAEQVSRILTCLSHVDSEGGDDCAVQAELTSARPASDSR